nr:hypothetical protein L203_01067 [Cryptococcus depauperatus CBS 7841]
MSSNSFSSRPQQLRSVYKTNAGVDPANTSVPRTQAEKYFARVANENIIPNRLHKALGFGGWVLGSGTGREESKEH